MANEVDELMDKDPLELSSQDIDAIIAYQRKYRANKESGVKQSSQPGTPPKVTIDLKALGLIKAGEAIKRRI